MKKNKHRYTIIITIFILTSFSVTVCALTEKYSLQKNVYKEALEKAAMYQRILKHKKCCLLKIQENEAEYQNYYDLWEPEVLLASNRELWMSKISRIAAKNNVLLRHIEGTEHDNINLLECEVLGDFEAVLNWLSSCENLLYCLKTSRSQWNKDDSNNTKLNLTFQVYDPRMTK